MVDLTSPFRGYASIREVVERMGPMGVWMEKFKPECKHLTLKRRDFDLLERWPKAAALFEIQKTPDGGLYWKSFRLYPDTGPSRYPPFPPIPKNEEIL